MGSLEPERFPRVQILMLFGISITLYSFILSVREFCYTLCTVCVFFFSLYLLFD